MQRLLPLPLVFILGVLLVSTSRADGPLLRIATFQVDATPPLGSPLCVGSVAPAEHIVDPLSARGIILLGEAAPIVLCSVDWEEISNTAHDAWCAALARAVGTTDDRVSVHVVHQHDAPGVDFLAEQLLAARGLSGKIFHVAFAHDVIRRAAQAAKQALKNPRRVTHVGYGMAKVEKVASNRRLLGPDGKVDAIRWSSCLSAELRARPEGTIDPYVRLLSFWDGEKPLACMSYYATHPQSYYGRGGVSADFVGMARSAREAALPSVTHVHFNGAGGNIAAGKYNDESTENRLLLAGRLAAGMRAAWDATKKTPIRASQINWHVRRVKLPPRYHDKREFLTTLNDNDSPLLARIGAAQELAFLRRASSDHHVTLGCLKIGPAYVLHMPGELFVEYQLTAQAMRPEDFVCMAAYGDMGAEYIGTRIAYGQGGYETSHGASSVAPEVEEVLLPAIRNLLGLQDSTGAGQISNPSRDLDGSIIRPSSHKTSRPRKP